MHPRDTERIILTGLRVQTRVGWTESERATPQLVLVDIDLTLDAATAGSTDDLADTVDYSSLARRVADLVSGTPRRLLETVAADVAADVLRHARVDAATVTVHKPRAPLPVAVDDVAVAVTRHRRSGDAEAPDTGECRGTGGQQ